MNTTTREGFLMNTLRRIPRHMVKALAAGAVLVAAALPMAFASVAGAAGADAITAVAFAPSPSGSTATSGALFGTGASGTAILTGTFSGDGSTATLTTNAPGVTFTNVNNTSTTSLTGIVFTSTSATVPGTYNLTYTDDGGTVIDNAAFTVNAAPDITSFATATWPDTTSFNPLTTTFSGAFVGTPLVVLTSTVNGTTIVATAGASGGTTLAPASSDTIVITPENSVNHALPATPGTYTATIYNPDGGTYTSGVLFTITGNEISSVSPSAISYLPVGDTTLTVSGGGFENGATVALGTCPDVTLVSDVANVTSGSSFTIQVDNAGGESAPAQCSLTVTNSGSSDNGASFDSTLALGVGEGDGLPPVITTSSLTAGTAIVPGAPATTIQLTGTGFSTFTVPGPTYVGTTADTHSIISGPCLESAGTTMTCALTVTTGALGGAHVVSLENGTAAQQTAGGATIAPYTGSLANGFTVAGPAITSAAPVALAVGAPVGTTVVLTGTGFANTSTGTVTANSTGLNGIFVYVSATTENFVVTASPTAAGAPTFTLSTVDAYGDTEVAAPFTYKVDLGPSISSITYKTGTTGVGIGATAQTVTINGSGFAAGATITAFTNAAGTADADVTAKLVSVNQLGTSITATVAVAVGDTNAIDGYTVTNLDGGTAKAAAVAPAGLTIDAAPTITAVSPVTATPAATTAFTVTGTDFQTGATVVLSSDGTCGAATVASATSITVSCTVGEPGTAAVTLSVVNPDGGTATSATVLPAAAAPSATRPHATKVHGYAVIGKTVTLTISGTGFYGKPRVTSTGSGVRVAASHDSGTLLTVRISVSAKGRMGEHTLTITDADGKSCRINYATR
jgi:hypothetical protein